MGLHNEGLDCQGLMCISSKSHISHDVLTYLVEHQDAQDTLDGIVEWWLMEQKIIQQTATVKEVLDELVAQELVLERKSLDSHSHYSVNQRKTKEILEQLKERPE